MEVLDRFASRVWFIDLAPLTDPELVPDNVAMALGVHEEIGRPTLESLIFFLRSRKTLLVLDNCEHLLQACRGLVDALLRACPSLKMMVSSREALGVVGEAVYRVPSLSYPEAYQTTPLEDLMGYTAVRLLVERVRLLLPDYQVSGKNGAALVRICRRLDGIPLALELAAARLNVLTADQVAERLEHAFHFLTGGKRAALR
jgi:predicted ATPase